MNQLLSFTMIMLMGQSARVQRLRKEEGGASVLEWALIAAVVVFAAGIIGVVVVRVVRDRTADLERCSDATAGC